MTALSIPARFAEQAALAPDATAVSEAASGAELTYRELEQRANRLAHHLIGLGVGHEDRVAVLMERSADLVVAFLAICSGQADPGSVVMVVSAEGLHGGGAGAGPLRYGAAGRAPGGVPV